MRMFGGIGKENDGKSRSGRPWQDLDEKGMIISTRASNRVIKTKKNMERTPPIHLHFD